jgi:hypothetical protein
VETRQLMDLLTRVWIDCETNEKYIPVIVPVFLSATTRDEHLKPTDVQFLCFTCSYLLSEDNDWDHPRMIEDLLDICGEVEILTLHLCLLLVAFLAKGMKKLKKMRFENSLLEEMTRVARELLEKDSSILTHLMCKCQENQPLLIWIRENFFS